VSETGEKRATIVFPMGATLVPGKGGGLISERCTGKIIYDQII
jgi:hypothetical protein